MNKFEKNLRTELALTFMTRIPFIFWRGCMYLFCKPRYLMSEKERKAYEKAQWKLS